MLVDPNPLVKRLLNIERHQFNLAFVILTYCDPEDFSSFDRIIGLQNGDKLHIGMFIPLYNSLECTEFGYCNFFD